MKRFIKEIIIGIVIGLIMSCVAYAFWVGMGREIERQEQLSEYNCEMYEYCK